MAILIAHQSPEQRDHLASLLSAEGFKEVVAAESAHHAFEYLGFEGPTPPTQEVDLILLDVRLPDRGGVAACALVNERDRLRDIPIIMLARGAETSELEAAFEAGALDYVVLPPSRIELLARVRAALRMRREIERRRASEKEAFEITRLLDAAYQRLQRVSFLDGLTEIANRRRFDEFIDHEWRRALRSLSPLSMIMIDIDFFKAFNDTYGHQQGDDCLRRVARALNLALHRPGDLAARYGGEEFAVVLADADRAGAVVVAETLRAKVEALAIPHAGSKVSDRITISLGVGSTIPAHAAAPATLIEAADRALYRAKAEGRNRVKVAEGA